MTRLAAIDCGTHSIRLLISDVTLDGRTTDVVRQMRIVGLGEGVDRTHHLSAAALARTFAAVEDYAEMIRQAGAVRVRMVATSASRDADNFAEFAAGVEARLGVAPQVITGHEEASLGFAGTLSAHTGLAAPALVVDIGGGSTEFSLGFPAVPGSRSAGGAGAEVGTSDGNFQFEALPQLTAAVSMNMGSTRVTERFLRPSEDEFGVPSEEAIAAASDFIDSLIAKAAESVPLASAREVIGVAGSVTTLTALALGLDEYDPARINGAVLDSAQLRKIAHRLIRLPHAEKAKLGPMHPKRVTQIAGGVLVWERILYYLETQPAPQPDPGEFNTVDTNSGQSEQSAPLKAAVLTAAIYQNLNFTSTADEHKPSTNSRMPQSSNTPGFNSNHTVNASPQEPVTNTAASNSNTHQTSENAGSRAAAESAFAQTTAETENANLAPANQSPNLAPANQSPNLAPANQTPQPRGPFPVWTSENDILDGIILSLR